MEHNKIWDYYFGISVYYAKCSGEDCFSSIARKNFCTGVSNHRKHQVWEIEDNYFQLKDSSSCLLKKRPICCDCNRKNLIAQLQDEIK